MIGETMKKYFLFLLALALVLCPLSGCTAQSPTAQVAATTLPVYEFTTALCQGTPITVTRLITESVSCLHEYSLQVSQMRAAEAAQVVIISGAGLEEFMEDILENAPVTVDASQGIPLRSSDEEGTDPHIWLSPANARLMAQNICDGLIRSFPAYADTFSSNLNTLNSELLALEIYGNDALSDLRCRDLVTFHDGFSYFAEAFGLNILHAVEEESGSEASAFQLIELIELVNDHNLPAIFTEENSSTAAASVIAAETVVKVCSLDMAMAGDSYFDAMYHNIDTIKEALG